jgi:hypothetical protein
MSAECKCGFDHWPLPCKSESPVELRMIGSARFGALVFRGCKKHPNGENSSCAGVRKEQTGEILNSYEIWEVMQELARANSTNSHTPKATMSEQSDQSTTGEGTKATVRRFAKKPGPGWQRVAGSVWEHTTGLRIHLLGLARLPNGHSMPWHRNDEYEAMRQQGYNTKRALMVWALSLI